MRALRVAEILLDAIRRQQLYVLTDTDWDARIEARHAAIMQRGSPSVSAR